MCAYTNIALPPLEKKPCHFTQSRQLHYPQNMMDKQISDLHIHHFWESNKTSWSDVSLDDADKRRRLRKTVELYLKEVYTENYKYIQD